MFPSTDFRHFFLLGCKSEGEREIICKTSINHMHKLLATRVWRSVNTLAKHVTLVAAVQRFASARARGSRLRQLNRHFRYGGALPFEASKAMTVGTITLHAQRLVRVHRKKFINMRHRPLDGSVICEPSSSNVDVLMVFSVVQRREM